MIAMLRQFFRRALLQLGDSALACLRMGMSGVGILPNGEEILIRLASAGRIARKHAGAREAEVCERIRHFSK